MTFPKLTWQKMIITLVLSATQAGLLLWLLLIRTEIPVIKDAEFQLFKAIDFFDYLFTHKKSEQPYVFIDTSNDQCVVTEQDGKQIFETDYDRLSELLSVFSQQKDNIQFIYCDLFADESSSLSEKMKQAVVELNNKILFASQTEPSTSEKVSIKYDWLPKAVAIYDQLEGYLISYPLVLTDLRGNSTPTAPLRLFLKLNKQENLPIGYRIALPSLFTLGDGTYFRNPILNFRLRNDDLIGMNKPSLYPKHNLFELVKHCHEKNFITKYNLANKLIVVGNLNSESLDDKHPTSADDKAFGALIVINALEMLQSSESKIEWTWLFLMYFSLFIVSIKSILLIGFGYRTFLYRKLLFLGKNWLAFLLKKRKSNKNRFIKTQIKSLIAIFKKILILLKKCINFFKKPIESFIDHWIVEIVLDSETREEIKNLFVYFKKKLFSWLGFSVLLCILSYVLYGIKFEFLLLTFYFSIEDRLLYRLNSFLRRKSIKY